MKICTRGAMLFELGASCIDSFSKSEGDMLHLPYKFPVEKV
jgi:hypothetical protein